MKPATIVTVQPAFAPVSDDVDASLYVQRMILRLADVLPESDLIVMPECANACGLEAKVLVQEAAERADTFLQAVQELARQKASYVVAPVLCVDDGILRNMAVVYDRQGDELGRYRKIYPTREERRNGVQPGDEPVMMETDFCTLAIAICYGGEKGGEKVSG